MSHKKMLQCSMGALLLLLPWFGGLVLGEISDDFSQCLKFFYKETPPTGLPAEGDQYQPICQVYLNRYRFATLYVRERRSPLYSAYILSPPDKKTKYDRPDWMYEPQLESPKSSKEMQILPPLKDQDAITSQATEKDFRESIFTIGHLNPMGHHGTKEEAVATFTLTNTVPQRSWSNNKLWSDLEQEVSLRKKFCTGTMHVITGVMPYNETHLMNKKVSVPEYMWSAYCCPSFKPDLPESVKASFPTYAAVGRNDPDSTEEIVPVDIKVKELWKGYDVKPMSLEELEGILRKRLNMPINLFNGQCK